MNTVEKTITKETIKLFAKKGYAATSIRDIANAVNMKSASLYYYMENKKELLIHIMESYLTQLLNGAKETIYQYDKPEEQLKYLIKFHVLSHGYEKLAALVVDTEYRSLEGESKQKIKGYRKEYERIWLSILNEGKEKGVFHFPHLNVTSYALISLCTGVAHWYREDGDFSLEQIADQYALLGLKMVHFNGGESDD